MPYMTMNLSNLCQNIQKHPVLTQQEWCSILVWGFAVGVIMAEIVKIAKNGRQLKISKKYQFLGILIM